MPVPSSRQVILKRVIGEETPLFFTVNQTRTVLSLNRDKSADMHDT